MTWSTSPFVSTDRLDGAVAKPELGIGMQLARLRDLLAQVGGGVEQHPIRAVTADGERGLRARPESGGSRADGDAVLTIAIPLRKAATGARPQDLDDHGNRLVWRRADVAGTVSVIDRESNSEKATTAVE